MTFPDNIVAERHDISGKWVLQYLTDEQAERCHHALSPAYNIGVKIPRRSPELMRLSKWIVGESEFVPDREMAHRWRVYLSRVFGTGAGAYRSENGVYKVWRVK